MIKGKTVLIVVPARGGSKGIPLKNLRMLGGLSLVARVGRLVSELPFADRCVISTDNEAIKQEGRRFGLDAPFTRPPALSGDRVGDLPVLQHALTETERLDSKQYDIVVMLQPTSPLRTPAQVVATVEKLSDGNYDSVWTVSPTNLKYHPLKLLRLTDDDSLFYYDDRGATIIARQQLESVYHRNGIAYAMTRQCLLETQALMGKRASAFVIEGPTVSIDDESDLRYAETMLECRN